MTTTGTGSWIVEPCWSGRDEPDPDGWATARAVADERTAESDFLLRTLPLLLACEDAVEACTLLAHRLQSLLGCRHVAIGLCDRRRQRCTIRGISGVTHFDAHGETVRALRDAVEEAALRGGVTMWPPGNPQQRGAALAHQQLLSRMGARHVASVPLTDSRGLVVGVVLVVDGRDTASASPLPKDWAAVLAELLGRLQRERENRLASWLRARAPAWIRRRGLVLLAVAAGLVLLALPVPHRVRCECVVQPVLRRFVVAPYDGLLEKCLVAPGDVIRCGDALARMDEREIRWELAGLQADHARAEKERDAARAGHKTSSAQLAELDMQRLDLQMRLLNHRLEHLALRSPIDGVVVAGDLQTAEGAPLTIGQSLFEVAPLERMLFEISVPEEDVTRVTVGLPVQVSLDAAPGQDVTGVIQRIHPRAELRDNASVFVADMELDNHDGQLRPGMNGTAYVRAGHRSLGWLWFHKPWARLRHAMAW